MKLSTLIDSLVLARVTGDAEVEITGIETDSRKLKPGDLFIALRGFSVDGHRFVSQAVERGAAAVMVEEDAEVPADVPQVCVPDTRRAMAVVAAVFFRHPTRDLKLLGVTGTNGKTTTAHLIRHLLQSGGDDTGLIGTIHMQIGEDIYPVKNTTPESVDLQRSFRKMADAGCRYAVIEASSHALDMGRTWGCEFRTAIFTNLTQDHLDYHETMERYRDAKGLLFSQLGNRYEDSGDDGNLAVLNADDPVSAHYARMTPAQVITYGIEKKADVRAENIRFHPGGTCFTLSTWMGDVEIDMKLMGTFSVYNALAASTVALAEGMTPDAVRDALQRMEGVDGRFQRVDAGQSYTVLVDYAHTPDSLKNVLATIREFAEGAVTCVVGCGGDRDRTKRPLMASIAAEYSDKVVITSDNPRTEDPQRIIEDMMEGLKEVPEEKYTAVLDREAAIRRAVEEAEDRDVILIAGKGHETYQEVNGVRYDFDDRETARKAIQQRGSRRT
ncbi:UDP-N-acetylmuramoyl-L-alanyl-D-glutamate--2,6-diaminopimelate ligase [Paludifilum halophilum]|uniref:UDP-N-acetylmuramoyl-L-alanyl-D-glutamate--2,6-diaminopimelate ligase n=1 Tax=Paludifilum halophilum TaxID=1642702 RepID=A0A235B2T5_9BACL|nr:UDP-N-acetylmuramoyl-L-alanyl-D-glutamate--2,6-diaminopimelate ligase [Paludifilum halophilum]OYD06616.1 UDP-N-acetylmuramoyl-L-alanyl-D-glutamate--2,6-diaminopimelate ligase [Paludifilum halophilum]